MNERTWNEQQDKDIIKGTVERIVFLAPDSNYVIFRILEEANDMSQTVTGYGEKPLVGDRLEIHGHWVEHRRFGRQFAASSWSRLYPDTVDGMERFLGSGAVKGIGPSLAKRIVRTFGLDTMDILVKDPEQLLSIEGIGKKKLATITESFYEEQERNNVALLLETHGISGRLAGRLLQAYDSDVQYVLEHEPYRIIQEVEGIGFKTADQIALAFGMDTEAEERRKAGLVYAMQSATLNGHVCIPDTELVYRTAKLLQCSEEALWELLHESLQWGELHGEEYNGTTYVYMPYMYDAECDISEKIKELIKMKPLKTHISPAYFLDSWQEEQHFELAQKQRDAVEQSLQSGLLVITGGPGTGKTTVVQTIISLAEQERLHIRLCAPTGRAAKRLTETTSREALTIHRLLVPDGYDMNRPVFEFNETNPLKADLIIVDEVSMLDMSLFHSLLLALKPTCRLILVGDADQLPSVGAGSILHDIIRSEKVPVVRLDTIFRQRDGGRIVTNAHLINSGRLPIVNVDEEFQFKAIESEEQGAQIITTLYQEEVAHGKDSFAVQVLSPMYRLDCGVDNLNKAIQEAVNPPGKGRGEIKDGNTTYRIGDKVMQKQNDYEKGVFNGDIGEIFAIGEDVVHVRYPEQDVAYHVKELGEITLAYAITVHKSQGGEYQTVIIVLVSSHAIMLQRNLFYTAVTRAKKKVIIIGVKAAMERAVTNVRTSQRKTLLAERIRGEEMV